MQKETFNGIAVDILDWVDKTIVQKGNEYAPGTENPDRLANFKTMAVLDTLVIAKPGSPMYALWGAWKKHWASIIDIMNTPECFDIDKVREKIGDNIVYSMLFEAVFREMRGEDNV